MILNHLERKKNKINRTMTMKKTSAYEMYLPGDKLIRIITQ